MKRFTTALTAAAALTALTGGAATAVPATSRAVVAAVPAAAPCTTQWRAVETVAVRRPAWNEDPVATMRTRVDHYLHRGDVVTSCVAAMARTETGPAYRACGHDGYLWQIVRGGQVPRTCLKRV